MIKKYTAFLLTACMGTALGIATCFFFQVTDVTDSSMMPSYEEGEHILISRKAFDREKPERGAVVFCANDVYTLTGEGSTTVKRVAGVSGDSVFITGGQVYVNNKALDEEAYLLFKGFSGEMSEVRVPEGHVFLLGDNRGNSTDSRNENVGMVKVESLLGKVIYKW